MKDMIPIYTLSSARINAGMSLKKASDCLGITVRTLSNYENGHSLPGLKVLEKIPSVYGIPTDAIFFGDEYRLKRYKDEARSGILYEKIKNLIVAQV